MAKRPAACVVAPAAAAFPVRRRLRGKQSAADYERMPHAEPAALTPARKRPAAAAAETHLCRGRAGDPCTFSTSSSGARARYQGPSKQCPWCSPALLTTALSTKQGKVRMSRGLRFFWNNNKGIFAQARSRLPADCQVHFPLQALGMSGAFHSTEAMQKAMAAPAGRGRVLTSLRKKHASDPQLAHEALKAIPEEHQAGMREKMGAESRRAQQAKAKQNKKTAQEEWEEAVAHRQSVRANPKEAMVELYESRVAEDRARLQRKFFPRIDKSVRHTGHSWCNPLSEALKQTIQDVAPNDTGLPAAQCSHTASMLEQLGKLGSWAICTKCNSLEPRHLKEVDTRRVAAPLVASCRWCQGEAAVPQPGDVPRALRRLTPDALAALRPLVLDCGVYERPLHGYRVHSALARLSWSEEAVSDKIQQLPRKEKKKAQKAYDFLMQRDSRSEYRNFVKQHKDFLRQNPAASASDRRRPLQMLEVTW